MNKCIIDNEWALKARRQYAKDDDLLIASAGVGISFAHKKQMLNHMLHQILIKKGNIIWQLRRN